MRSLLILTGGLVLAGTGCLLFAGRDEPEARAVVERAIAASGGKAGLATLARCAMQTKGVMIHGRDRTPFTARVWQDVPTRLRQEMTLQTARGPETVITVVDGDGGWRHADGRTVALPADEVRAFRHSMRASEAKYLYPLLAPGTTLTLLPGATVKGRPALGVRVAHAGEPDSDLYFDRDQGVLVKYAGREAGVPHLREEYYEHYEPLGGLPWPMRKTVYVDGVCQVEREAVGFQPLSRLDPALFARP